VGQLIAMNEGETIASPKLPGKDGSNETAFSGKGGGIRSLTKGKYEIKEKREVLQ